MTLTPELYDKVNRELVKVLDKYSLSLFPDPTVALAAKEGEMTQYDLMLISCNLVSSVIQVISIQNNTPRDALVAMAMDLIRLPEGGPPTNDDDDDGSNVPVRN